MTHTPFSRRSFLKASTGAAATMAAAKLLLAFERWAVNRQVHEININMSVAIDMERFDRFMTHAGYRACGQNYFKPTRQRAAV